jgi:hypothetical protein
MFYSFSFLGGVELRALYLQRGDLPLEPYLQNILLFNVEMGSHDLPRQPPKQLELQV